MTRISMTALSRYLLSGRIPTRGCLFRRKSPVTPVPSRPLPLFHRPGRSSPLHTSAETKTSAPTEEQVIPLRKKLKDEARQLKKEERNKSKSSNQTVKGWELTVGIEVHAQLNTARKLFSPAATSFQDDPNCHVALFDVAMPGSQPLFQKETLIPAIRAALVLDCDIQRVSRFDRKHYFWWDQPSGYQITQYYEPFAKDGRINLYARDGIATQDGESVSIGIKQVQLEQDTAKTLAQTGHTHWLDFNRVGIPLIEIITEPEIHHPRTAAVVVRKIQLLLNAVDACVSGMETGGMRADINVSVRRVGDASNKLGTRTEIKNLSTIKAVEDAIIAERDRQIQELEAGGVIVGETRGWTLGTKHTRRLRGKEGEVDYRYMPDPDLGPLVIGDDLISHIKDTAATSPDTELDALVTEFGLTSKDAVSLINLEGGNRLEYFYNVVDDLGDRVAGDGRDCEPVDAKSFSVLVGNWVLHEFGRLTADRPQHGNTVSELDFTTDGQCKQVPISALSELLYYLHRRKITGKVAKQLLVAMYQGLLDTAHGVAIVIDTHNLWFKELPAKEYVRLADVAIEGEERMLKELEEKKFLPHGKLMYLVGKMMRMGPTERIDPASAEKVIRGKVEEMLAAKA